MYAIARSLWKKAPFRWLAAIISAAFLGIAAGHTVIGLSGSVSVVDGASMEPTYKPGARVYTGPISGCVERGDVVMVDDHSPEYALKRVVGLPGETIQFWRGYVFINCRMLREPYLPKYTFTFPDESVETGKVSLGPDQYYVLGDNRTRSVDSRSYGPLERKDIKSRVPMPPASPRAWFINYTLPPPGKRNIRSPKEKEGSLPPLWSAIN